MDLSLGQIPVSNDTAFAFLVDDPTEALGVLSSLCLKGSRQDFTRCVANQAC